MSEMKHTPEPWSVDKRPVDKRNKWWIRGPKTKAGFEPAVASIPNLGGYDERAANAEFIVRACNAHDDLLAAMQEAIDLLTDNVDNALDADQILRAAIAKATTK